jgi:DNA-binding transcriptional MerR regulator
VFTIGQLCRELSATPRALRFYEELGMLFPRRRGTERIYNYKDRARLILILRGRRVGLSLTEIREILDAYEDDGEAVQNARALQVFRRRIVALESQREHVDEAIDSLQRASERLASLHPELSASA